MKDCGVIETTGRTNNKTVKINKSILQLSTTTPTVDTQTQKNINQFIDKNVDIAKNFSLVLKKDR